MSLKQRVPFLRWSFLRLAIGARNITKTGQIGDGREAAAADYVVANARQGDIDDVIAKVDQFAYEKSFLINVGDEKGELLDAAVRRANPGLALELGTYCGYSSLRIARAAPSAKVFSVELAEANAEVARRIWAHAGIDDRVTCVVGTIGDGGKTLDSLADEHGFAAGKLDFLFIDHDKARLPARPAEHPGPRLAAPGIDRGRRQHPHSGLAEVPRVHEPAAGQALRHRRAQDTRRVSDAGARHRARVGVLGG